jgi:hypothetical protein
MGKPLGGGRRHGIFRGELLGEQNPEIEEQLYRSRRGKKQIAQRIWRDRPKNHFAFGERFLFGGNTQKHFALAVPLAGSKRRDVGLAEILVPLTIVC